MRLQPLHLWLLTAQIVFSVAVYGILLPFSPTVAQGGMICVLTPIAMAAVVIGGMLGADIVSMTTFSLLCNMTIAVVAPFILSVVGSGDCSLAVILARVAPLLILPFAAAQGCRALIPKVSGWVAAHSQISFYLWLVSLTVIIGRTTTFILDHPEADGAVETALAATALVICLVQFRFGFAGWDVATAMRSPADSRSDPEEYGAGRLNWRNRFSRSDLVGRPDSLYRVAELREQLSVVAERVRRRSTGRSERMTIKNKVMKVLLINGSPRKQGNTFLALSEVASALEKQGITTEIVSIGTKAVQGCIACNKCGELGRCVFRDELYDTLHGKLAGADGLVVGSPTYYAGPNGSLCAILDRLFYSAGELLRFKPAAAVAVCRRGGASATFDRLNKYFTINNMPVVSSQYWNSVHGRLPGEATQDAEGMQTMRTLGDNMAWLLKNIQTGKIPLPEPEEPVRTNFIR